ncbi:MAG TPA: septum site-determining protein Ssd [Mycobacteriales bacterium]|nr:septum site-determining protein Ssd [Mycobacteriales bacterium]
MSAPTARPLLVSGDPNLLDDLLRLAAAAGVEADVASECAGVGARWAHAALVVVGVDAADALATAALPRRRGVVVVGQDLADASVWQQAVALGADRVVGLPEAQEWLVDRFARTLEAHGGQGRMVSVIGGRGGAGASTLSAALSLTAAGLGWATLLVDADPLGGGIHLVLGGEAVSGLRWPDLVTTRGRLSATALHDALPRVDGLPVLSWDRGGDLGLPAEALAAVLDAGMRGSRLTVVDLPRHPGDATVAAVVRSDIVLLVVPAEVRAAAAAARVALGVAPHTRDLRVVVRGPAPSGLPADAVADSLGLPLAGMLRAEPGLPAALDRGEPPARRRRGPLADFCRRFLSEAFALPAAA